MESFYANKFSIFGLICFQSGFQMPSSNRPNFGPRSYPGSQRHSMSQPQFGGSFGPHRNMRGGPMPPRPRNVYMGPSAAMTKRTVQTTQKFFKGNNIYTQTMTVVQEVQLQAGDAGMMRSPFASNGPVGRGSSSNPRFGGATGCGGATQTSSSSSNHSGGIKRKNSADVITLE